jgi:uncharacterized HhH-GPD family protein
MAKPSVPVTGDPASDQLLTTNPFALLVGMLLDQQVPMEWAFGSPLRLKERLGGELEAAGVAAADPAAFEEIFRQKPPLHRYPASMAKRVQTLAQFLVDHYDGDAARVWTEADDGADLYTRVRALPGYGDQKAKIFVALLAKRMGIAPAGWEAAAGAYADDTPRSVADVDSPETLQRVREFKRAQRAEKKSAG